MLYDKYIVHSWLSILKHPYIVGNQKWNYNCYVQIMWELIVVRCCFPIIAQGLLTDNGWMQINIQ